MCPKCDEPMLVLELEGIEIDHCLECLGTWLDSGEIEMICAQAGGDVTALAKAIGDARRGPKTDARCPRCGARLRSLHIGERTEVELDFCPRDHGLWFDRGEMRTLISAHEDEGGREVGAFFADLYRSEMNEETEGEQRA